jgi:hypothetical protein
MTRVGPFTEEELAEELLIKGVKQLREVLAELTPTFLERSDDGIYRIAKWDEKAGEASNRKSGAERQAALRERRKREQEALRNASRNDVTSDEKVTPLRNAKKVTDQREKSKEDLPSASLREDAREESDANKASPALRFCFWFLDAGIAAGAIRGCHALDKLRWALPEVQAAESILAEPDMTQQEAQTRAERLFAMKVRGNLRREANVRTLLSALDWDEIKGTFSLGGRRPAVASDVEGL